ncbi:MAG: hypothetical protein HYR62_07215 [Actinobacteria bacterium]|nr:hypothetical protein [Actinomycetota bacterium]MBI3685965.1 hypothetical protein [Actinomycetota bacterium]
MNDIDDEVTLAQLRALAEEFDPVPELVLETAMAAFTLRKLDAELVELIGDSYDQPAESVVVRSTGTLDVRMLSFRVGLLSLELQVTARGARRKLVAQVEGVRLVNARIETGGSTRDLAYDDGVLVAEDVPAGPIRFRLTTDTGGSFLTSWVLI